MKTHRQLIIWLVALLAALVLAACTPGQTPPAMSMLTVTKAGTGTGTVTSDPEGINCGTDCEGEFAEGTEVVLTAAPDAEATVAWSGPCATATGNTCDLVIGADDTAVTVTFTAPDGNNGGGGWETGGTTFRAAVGDDTAPPTLVTNPGALGEAEVATADHVNTAEEFLSDSADLNADGEVQYPAGFTYTTSSDLDLPYDSSSHKAAQLVGVRFVGVSLADLAAADAVVIEFTAADTSSQDVALEIRAQLDAGATAFVDGSSEDISSRTMTEAVVLWEPEAWTAGATYQTPDLSPLIEELQAEGTGDWSAPGPIVFIITPPSLPE